MAKNLSMESRVSNENDFAIRSVNRDFKIKMIDNNTID